MALRIGIRKPCSANAPDFVEHHHLVQGRLPKRGPIVPLAAPDHIIDRRKREPLVVQVPMLHRSLATLAQKTQPMLTKFQPIRWRGQQRLPINGAERGGFKAAGVIGEEPFAGLRPMAHISDP